MLRPKKKYWLKKTTEKTAAKKKERSKKLDVYYETLIEKCYVSEESGKPIFSPGRINICHLLKKSVYKSVEDDLNNHIMLLASEHLLMDNLLDRLDFESLKKFKSWGLICERVRKLLPKITERKKLILKFIDYFEEKFGGNKNND